MIESLMPGSSFSGRDGTSLSSMSGSEPSWSDRDISSKYLDAIEPQSEVEVNKTKKLYHDPFFYSILPNLDGITALDLGSGNYYMSSDLQRQHPTSTFIASDLPSMVNEATERRRMNLTIKDHVTVIAALAQDAPFANSSLDLITSSLMMHWAEQAQQIINEAYRILKQEGTCVISLAHPKFFKSGKFERMDTKDPYFVPNIDITNNQELEVYLGQTIGPITYYLRPLEEYRRLFKQAGFSQVDIFEPLFTNEKEIVVNDFMKKYKKYPLYLFVKAIK